MIDIKNLRQNPQAYQDSASARGVDVSIAKLLELDATRSGLLSEVEGLRAQLNLKGKPSDEELAKLQDVKAELEIKEVAMNTLEMEYTELLLRVPNLLAEGTPAGGEEANREEKIWGPVAKRDVLDHMAYAEAHDLLDFERAAKVAGAKFVFQKGAAVRLEMSIMRMVMDLLEKKGFMLMSTPHMVNNRVLEGTGFQPRGEEDQIYRIEGEDLNLIGTAEIPLTGYHADEIIDASKLPLAYASLTPSYRKEAGAYGKHSKGYYRVHQFGKLEMYIVATPEQSAEWHDKLTSIEEEILQSLEIPYRVVRIAAGDLGAPAYKKYDLEYYSPVDGSYRELTSCSNCTDFQSRRLNIRTRRADGKTQFVHTLNGTAAAFSRMFIAFIENHQTPEGSVRIPVALQAYYGGETL